jgi:hypothetical protein
MQLKEDQTMKKSLLSFGLVLFFAGLLLACSGDGGTGPDTISGTTPVIACNLGPHSTTIYIHELSGGGEIPSNDHNCSFEETHLWELPRHSGQNQTWTVSLKVNGHELVIFVSVINGHMGANGYVIEPDGTHSQVTNRWGGLLALKDFDVGNPDEWITVEVHFYADMGMLLAGIEFTVLDQKP